MTDMNSPSHPSLRVEIDRGLAGYAPLAEPIFIGCTTGAPADPSKGNITVTVTGEGVGSAPGPVSISTTSGIERGSERSIINVNSVTIDPEKARRTSEIFHERFGGGIHAAQVAKYQKLFFNGGVITGDAVSPRYDSSNFRPDNRPTYPDGGPIGAEPVVKVGMEVGVHDRADRGKVSRVYDRGLVPGRLTYDVEFSDGAVGAYKLSDLTIFHGEQVEILAEGDDLLQTAPLIANIDHDMTPDRAMALNIRTQTFHHILAGLEALLKMEPVGVGFVATEHGFSPSMTHAEIREAIDDLIYQADHNNPFRLNPLTTPSTHVEYLRDEIERQGGLIDDEGTVSWPIKKSEFSRFIPLA